jgi:two-component system, OmpR family, phosphate regulon sensor histidine kinase PhoR
VPRGVADTIAALFGADPPRPPVAGLPEATASPDRISIEALADPALIVGAGQRVTAANAAACAVLGQRIVGKELVVGVRHPAVLDAVRRAADGPVALEREVTGLGRQDGLYRLRVVPDGEGNLLVTFADISQQRLTERMRVDFVANASHELRTPLATILGFIETLQGPAAEDEPARRRFLDIMGGEAARMARLIDDLLSLSRTLAMRLESDQRTLTVETPADLPRVTGDRDQVLQVLHNLVSNALKYGRHGTPIAIHAEAIEGFVRVTVLDQGEGIAPEYLPRMTERFYRIDTGRSRQMGGTGLGLAIVKHIVERHRGKLSIASKVGEGTAVSFMLPLAG